MSKDNGNEKAVEEGKVVYQPVNPQLMVVQCPCANTPPPMTEKGRQYTVLCDPRMADGAAQIKALLCNSCGHMVEVSPDAMVGEKTKLYVDPDGKRHFRLHCDPVAIGAKIAEKFSK